ncbi:MAG TPA: chemotaxis protein CheA [Thermoanaerobaculia bacterium]|nr:chemotaxis protein CheA [Thermoanaerobaculia bacterium]
MSQIDLNRDELVSMFLSEAAEDIEAIEATLLALEDAPDDAELRHELQRRVHTIKGNASCVGRDALTSFAHAYEERLELAPIAELLAGVDAFRRLLTNDEPEAGRPQAAPAAAHVRVAAEKLDRMLDLAGEIAIARGRVQQMLSTRADDLDALLEVERQTDQLQGELQELIMRARMVPVGPMFRQYARTVRDLAAAHGKNARLVTIGDDVELDTSAVELLRDPLTHMIRNAIDHGIEPSPVRVANGKAAVGHITLEARHEAGAIIIRVSDDGAGLDRAAIAERAHALGIGADGDRAIFAPGFTTADEITDLSGRGVGMDVVRRGIESLRGTISIATSEGEGTTFTIRLPLTLAVIDGFAVTAGEETYIVPMENVVECLELPPGLASDVLLLRDSILPYVRLRTLFALEGAPPARENLLIVQYDNACAGLVVDALHGAAQAVIKPLGNFFSNVPGIAGSSILGSGRVALILDTATILRTLSSPHARGERND